jgi:hypothetical protein
MENNFVEKLEAKQSLTGMLFRKTYLWMTFALVITALSAMVVAKSPALIQMIYGSSFGIWAIVIAELALVWFLSARIMKMSLASAGLMFIVYSVLNGAMLSAILFAYSPACIYKTFFITAGTFASVSLFGYLTKKDLSRMGSIMFMALIGLIIATVVNIFVHSSMLDIIISYVGVIVFVGLTAWDTQKLKSLYEEAEEANDSVLKMALLGALSLYLDFINLFLYLLRIFGRNE